MNGRRLRAALFIEYNYQQRAWRPMNMAYRIKRADDMPLLGRVMRERKGVYVVMIQFAKSRRHYGDEIVYCRTAKDAKAHIAKLYPTIKWGKR